MTAAPIAATAQRAAPSAAPTVVPWKNFAVLRGVAMVLVVLAHAWVPVAGFIVAGPSRPNRIALYAGQALVEICVPVFVFVSGFFMARFSSTWPTARAGARLVLGRYVGWTILHYVLYLSFGAKLDPWTTLRYAITGGDRGVWFLVLLVQLYILTPLLVPWVKAHPRRAVAFAAVLELLHSGTYYLRAAGLEAWVHREFVFLQLPFFILGILATGRGDQLVAALAGRRRQLAAATIAAFTALLLEQALLHRLFPGTHFFPETLTVTIAAGVAILWGFAADSRPSPAREALNHVGMRSLGILLVHGYALRGCVSILWHFERVLGLTSRPRAEAPLWVFGQAWAVVPLFAVSLGVPLLLVHLVERAAGKRVRTLLFG